MSEDYLITQPADGSGGYIFEYKFKTNKPEPPPNITQPAVKCINLLVDDAFYLEFMFYSSHPGNPVEDKRHATVQVIDKSGQFFYRPTRIDYSDALKGALEEQIYCHKMEQEREKKRNDTLSRG